MAVQIVKLAFEGPVHLGRGRLSDSGISCDAATLFSALFIEALHSGISSELLEAARSGALKLSDAFPFIGNNLYLPKPMMHADAFDAQNEARGERADSRVRKASKKLAFIQVAHYASYLAGTLDVVAELESFDLGCASLQTKVNLMRQDSEDARPYAVGGFTFKPGAGLYFIVDGDYNLSSLLELLSYAGLGGKRTSGYGRFKYAIIDDSPVEQVQASISSACRNGKGVLLSTALPRQDELSDELLEGARYRLIRRGGFVQSTTHSSTPQKKLDLYPFAAGSTFARRFEGDVFDVNATPGAHPVWRYAKALWMEV